MKIKSSHPLAILLLSVLSYQFSINPAFAASLPSSTNFKLQNYSFGAGGTKDSSSTNFRLNGIAGEVEFGRPSSTNFKVGSGLTYLMEANVPNAPTLSTPGNNYDRIKFVLNPVNDTTDTTYALQISTDNFGSDIRFIKSDGTVGSTLTTADFKSYTNWGGASGSFVTGLNANTLYYIRSKARQGNFTESQYGPSASITTSTASLTFTLDSSSITFNNLNNGNSYTDSTKTNTLTTSTNAYNGYTVYGRDNQPLTSPNSNTIANYTSPNSAPTTWSGTGFGYTTNDNNLGGAGGSTRFNSGTNYAGFTTTGPGDPVADNPGPVTTTPISGEVFTISYRVTGNSLTPAGKYTNTIIYTIVPSY